MKKLGFNWKLLAFALIGLGLATPAARAQIMVSPSGPGMPFTVSNNAVTTAGASGTYYNVSVFIGAYPPSATVTLGQVGTILILNGSGGSDEFSLNTPVTNSVTVNTGTTVANIGGKSAINISSGTGLVSNSGVLSANSGVVFGVGGSVSNAGTITGTISDGVVLGDGGTVTNNLGGTITGSFNGVEIKGGTAATDSVTNAGTITGTLAYGVVLFAGGAVTNNLGGTISGALGVDIENAAGSVSNAGMITGTLTDGVVLGAGGAVTNMVGGMITGNYNGVEIYGGNAATDSVTNTGTIASGTAVGSSNDGVFLGAGGMVTNIGNITGYVNGVEIKGGTAATDSVTNVGMIASGTDSANSKDGVLLGVGGSVSNLAGGSITGFIQGVDVQGAAGTVTNAGIIASETDLANSKDGVLLEMGGSVTNMAGGSISGLSNGVEIQGGNAAADSVTNAGMIASGPNPANSKDGVLLGMGGSVTNMAGGSITGSIHGVDVQGAAGAVTNAGTITGTNNDGIFLEMGGTVSNAAGDSITGGYEGVEIQGASGTVTNAGTITGTTNDGVILGDGGTLNNSAGASILGHADGVSVNTGIGAVTNAGTITGTTNRGVFLALGGTVTNMVGGMITGNYNGVEIDGGNAATDSVTNTGTIASGTTVGSNDGVFLGAGGTVSNLAGGSITGFIHGVDVQGAAGTVTNAGTITGTNNDGIFLNAGGTVTNMVGGMITGNYSGVEIDGGNAATDSVTNAGMIASGTDSAHSKDGVLLRMGGTVSNTTTNASITGMQNGVEIQGASGTLTNAGTITGTDNDGVILRDGGTLTNSAGASILGHADGVSVNNGIGAVTNAGTITGTTIRGVFLTMGGTVANMVGGSITGFINGVDVQGAAGTVTNAGMIIGTMNDGIFLEMGGTVSNLAGDYITGGYEGVEIHSASGTVTNAGTITGTNNDGVILGDGGTLNNSAGAFILGHADGVSVNTGIGAVTNAGTITGTTIRGVFLDAGGSVSNTGTITGLLGGVEVENGTGSVANSGTISGTSEVGIFLGGGGSVTNTGTITGPFNAIEFFGGAGTDTVLNSGTIQSSGVGIFSGGITSVTLQGGSIGGIAGMLPLYDVQFINAASSLTIMGRTQVASTGVNFLGTTGDKANLYIVGVTPAQAAQDQANEAAAVAGQPVTINAASQTYTFENFTFNNQFGTQFLTLGNAVDSGLRDLGNKLDAIGLPTTSNFDVFYNAALINPEAAVAALSGRVLTQGTNDLMVNSLSGLTSDLGNQFDSITDANVPGGIDLTHFSIGTSQTLAFIDTASQLGNLVNMAAANQLGGTTLSDSKTMTLAPDVASAPKWGFWASGTIQVAEKNSSTGDTGFHALNGSPTLGLDYRLGDFTVGALFSFITADASLNDNSDIQSNTELGGLYGIWQHDGWRVHAVAAGGASQYTDTRTTFDGTASSKPDGSDVISDVTGGYTFNLRHGFELTPEAGVQYTHLHQDAFTETGDPAFGISRNDFDTDSLRTHLGFRAQEVFQIAHDLQFIPQLRAAWYHECLDDSAGVSTSLTGAPALGSFTIRTFDPERDYALVGVGLNTAFTGYKDMPVGLFLNYDVQVGQDNFLEHNVNGGIRVAF